MSQIADALDEIRNGPAGPDIGAFFDFDGTIIEGYSAMAIYRHRLRNFEIGPEEATRTVWTALQRKAMTEDEFVSLAEMGIRSWAGRDEEDMLELGQRLFVQGIAKSLFHDAWRLVKAHQRQGHTVAIASSATRFQVEPMARELGVEHVLCTPLEVENGILTGKLGGRSLWGPGRPPPCRSSPKTTASTSAMSHAYANGDEDVDFLSSVGPSPPPSTRARDWPRWRPSGSGPSCDSKAAPSASTRCRPCARPPCGARSSRRWAPGSPSGCSTGTAARASTWPPRSMASWRPRWATSTSRCRAASTCGHTAPPCSSSTTRAA